LGENPGYFLCSECDKVYKLTKPSGTINWGNAKMHIGKAACNRARGRLVKMQEVAAVKSSSGTQWFLLLNSANSKNCVIFKFK
jgi:hypothetical protein